MDDAARLGAIAVSGFAAKTRLSFGSSEAQNTAIFADFFRTGFLPLEHTFVATVDDFIAGFITLRLKEPSFPVSAFLEIFRRNLGPARGLKALIAVPWLLQDPWDTEHAVFLEMMAVDAAFRSQGIGALLVAELFTWAAAAGRQSISGFVVQDNPAVKFYQRHGFIVHPPTFKLPWLTDLLYGFRGYHKFTYDLQSQTRNATAETA